jgi:hypothetical protein
MTNHTTREAWLLAAVELLRPVFKEKQHPWELPSVLRLCQHGQQAPYRPMLVAQKQRA